MINDENEENGEAYNIPLKDRELFTQTNDPPIKDLCDRINKGRLEVKADFQENMFGKINPN